MPDKPLTIATYAAGASLAAITLVYVFGPTYFLDDDAAQSSRSSRRRGVVGMYNPANDCFINSVLQTLAGLPDLRVYLIRELHRRKLDGADVYAMLHDSVVEEDPSDKGQIEKREKESAQQPEWKILGLQQGIVTAALKDVLDSLNERPIYKKTISAQGFVRVLEEAFRTRISRTQQDAQEFLQVVTERLSDEYNAGKRARRIAAKTHLPAHSTEAGESSHATLENHASGLNVQTVEELEKSAETIKPKMPTDSPARPGSVRSAHTHQDNEPLEDGDEDQGFPFEGKIESLIECTHCHFKSKPTASSFVTLTLNVPHQSHTTLNACFDGMLKVEYIDDFKCDRCRLQHALETKTAELSSTTDAAKATVLQADVAAIEKAIIMDPENAPKDVALPDTSLAPKRRISRHMRISKFPKLLAIHLNRSMWDAHSASAKNMAKVAFPETLPLGGLLDQHSYRLLGVVTHKGGHNSGHYESFRRQVLQEPYSTPASMGTEGVFSARGSPGHSGFPSPMASHRDLRSQMHRLESPSPSPLGLGSGSPVTRGEDSSSVSSRSSKSFSLRGKKRDERAANTSAPKGNGNGEGDKAGTPEKRSLDLKGYRRRREVQKGFNRWWRISDEKIKESKTADVLGMQKEVYLLFYEMVTPEGA
ncbi:hypothetical protein M8818_007889 [Zalaria obscura]|uniref:Uncharacterized protein n=1 Tax=Zalaria obscura TaxID=2024903 RepID=A0ACC3S3B6_9PEZI